MTGGAGDRGLGILGGVTTPEAGMTQDAAEQAELAELGEQPVSDPKQDLISLLCAIALAIGLVSCMVLMVVT